MKLRPSWRKVNLALLGFILFGMVFAGTQQITLAAHTQIHAHHDTPGALSAAAARPLPRMTLASPLASPVSKANNPGKFPFQTVSSADGRIIVHYYKNSHSFAEQFIELAAQDLQHPIFDTLGFSLKRPVNIYIYASRPDFLSGAPVTDAAETDALTEPLTSTVYLVSTSTIDDGATDSLPHELTHVVFHQNEDIGHLEGFMFIFFPLWLDEGLAAYDELTTTAVLDYQNALTQVVASDHLVDLLRDFNNNYPTDPNVDFNAYSEARSFITFLVSTYGTDTFHRFLSSIRNGNFWLAAEEYFGANLQILENRWESYIGYPVTGHPLGYMPLTSLPSAVRPLPMPALANRDTPYAVAWDPNLPVWVYLVLIALLLVELTLTDAARSRWRDYTARMAAMSRQAPLALPPALPLQTPPDPDAPASVRTAPASYATELAELEAAATAAAAAAAATAAKTPGTTSQIIVLARRQQRQFAPHPFAIEPWLTMAAVVVSIGAGFLAVWLDPSHDWQRGYVVAIVVVATSLLIQLWLALRDRLTSLFRLTGLVFLVSLLAVLGQQELAAPRSMALAYEQQGAYRLALVYFARESGSATARNNDLERVHIEWGNRALYLGDYPIAEAQLQDALALATSPSKADAAAEDTLVTSLGTDLQTAGNFSQALQVYSEQQKSKACSSSCHNTMQQDSSAVYLAWANDLVVTGNFTAALAAFHIITTTYGSTYQASTAKYAEAEIAAQQLLENALLAGAHADYSAMNRQLRALAARYPHTAAGGLEAAQTPELVTGIVADATGAAVSGDRLFFLAFTSAAQAEGFRYDFASDTTVFKVATTIGAGGSFSVRLQTGYWYVPVWDDPSWASNNHFNASQSFTNDAFTVHSYNGENVGLILGF
jgi:hypothetical protein